MFDRPLSSPCPILLVGAGGHAVSCIDVVERSGFKIVGLIGQQHELGLNVLSCRVLGCDNDIPDHFNTVTTALVAVGQIDTPSVRMRIYKRLREIGFDLPAIVSPLAYLSDYAKVGAGTIVMHGTIVNASAIIGDNCIVNTRALVEHDAHVGNHCHIATGAVLNGGCELGEGTFVGSGAVIREGVKVGRRCVIGMGALVRHDLPDGSVFYGTPQHGA